MQDEEVKAPGPIEEQPVHPSEVWAQLTPDQRAEVTRRLAEMAYKFLSAQQGDKDEPAGGSSPGGF